METYRYHFDLEVKDEGFMTAAKIQYVSKGFNIRELGYSYNGSMLVLKSILAMDYLWNRIRVQEEPTVRISASTGPESFPLPPSVTPICPKL